ncbi:MAG: hypothetical protein OJF62_001191 [Pseudolabrys sp.]|nr:hypothetical protein [Pseudolabrys sp.]
MRGQRPDTTFALHKREAAGPSRPRFSAPCPGHESGIRAKLTKTGLDARGAVSRFRARPCR